MSTAIRTKLTREEVERLTPGTKIHITVAADKYSTNVAWFDRELKEVRTSGLLVEQGMGLITIHWHEIHSIELAEEIQ